MDTMLALLISGRLARTLLLVPTDPLRSQSSEKCVQLNKLREIDAASDTVLNPVTRAISSGMQVEEIQQLAEANMIVATLPAIQLIFMPWKSRDVMRRTLSLWASRSGLAALTSLIS